MPKTGRPVSNWAYAALGIVGERRIPEAPALAAVLHVACGLLVVALAPALPAAADVGGVIAVGGVAAAAGVAIWLLPWHRWRPATSLWLVPEASALVVAYNAFARDPYVHALFLIVVWVWIGMTQRPGTAAVLSPVLLAAYSLPLVVRGEAADVASAAFIVPVSVVVAETVAQVAARLRSAEASRARSEARYASLVRHANEFVAVLGEDARIVYASPAVERMLGYLPERMEGVDGEEFVHPDDLETVSPLFERARTTPGTQRPVEFRMRHADSSWRWIEGTITNLLGEPAVDGIVVNGRDISERKTAEVELARMAYTDELTDLANRSALLDRLDAHLDAAAGSEAALGLLFLDLDGFKVINDSLGHAAGDRLLVDVARRLEATLTGADVCRFGGDEFVILLAGMDEPAVATAAADVVLDTLRTPFRQGDREMVVTASIGVVVAGAQDGDADELLRRADLALYRAKHAGRNRWALFDEELARQARRRLDLEADLRLGMERGDFVLHYQPEVDLDTNRIVGVEALLRWDHPTEGELAPGAFIDVAEDSGVIVPLGSWVLLEACRQGQEWRGARPDAPLVVSVNVSVHQLRQWGFVAHVAEALWRSGFPAHMLRLEITESVLLEPDLAGDVLPALRQLGVRIAIDDFGTGYSSLAYLQHLHVDAVKIDRSFLQPVDGEDGDAPVVAAIVAMAHSLDLEVVAEGVENPSQLGLLRRLGCDRAQGYLFARPLSPGDLLVFLRRSPAGAHRDPAGRASSGVDAPLADSEGNH